VQHIKVIIFLFLLLSHEALFATGKKKMASSSAPKSSTSSSSASSTNYSSSTTSSKAAKPAIPNSNPIFFNESTKGVSVTQPIVTTAIPLGKDFYSILGKDYSEANVQTLINSLANRYTKNSIEGNNIYMCGEKGIAFVVNSQNILQQVHFFNKKYFLGTPMSKYPYNLPQEINFNEQREQIEGKLGRPVSTSNSVLNNNLNANYLVNFNNYTITITYKTSNSDDYNALMEDVVVTKNEWSEPAIGSSKSLFNNSGDENLSNYFLYGFLGKQNTDRELSNYLSQNFSSYELHNFSDCYELSNNLKGVCCTFNKSNELLSFRLLNNRQFMGTSYVQFESDLPEGLNFNLTKEDVDLKLGIPSEISYRTSRDLSCIYKLSDKNIVLVITYSIVSQKEASATINDILIKKIN